MNIAVIIEYIVEKWVSIGIQCILTFLTFILIRYKYKSQYTALYLKKSTKKYLLSVFKSDPIIEKAPELYAYKTVKANFCNFDIFNLGGKYKKEIKDTIKEYGVGTCGPRGFYGTVDIHLELETKLAEVFGKESAILYSNYFTCIQSVIPAFCKSMHNIFVDSKASEAIKRGLTLSRSKIWTYDSLEDLEMKLSTKIPDKYVICERMGMNTGRIIDLKKLIELKKIFGFRIILDESYSLPFLYQRPEDLELYNSIELIIGSLSHGYPTNGGFCVGGKEAINYERLAAAAYVFSASLPAYISKAAICMLAEDIDYSVVRAKIAMAFKVIQKIVTSRSSPIVLIETQDVDKKIQNLKDHGYVVGRNGDYIRLCINEATDEKDLKAIGDIIKSG